MKLLLVAAGGAIGAALRFLVAGGIGQALPGPFPWGTLAVNLSGCLLIGVLWAVGERTPFGAAGPFLFGGLLGGFTTFSTFGLESLLLLRAGEIRLAAGYVLGSNLGGLAAVAAGFALARGALQLLHPAP